jgi:hypothetical protein
LCWTLSLIVTEDESEPCVYGAIIDMAVTVNFRKGEI